MNSLNIKINLINKRIVKYEFDRYANRKIEIILKIRE